ncbi:hypothetical protein B0H19DRAFT_1284640 [Mycena capillaripes]|nr:hypothetical protein B0H19DRAFT_1284640 [Mycena capillaripes]
MSHSVMFPLVPAHHRYPSSLRLVPTYKLAVDPSELPPTRPRLSFLQMTPKTRVTGSLTAISRARMDRPDVGDTCTFPAASSNASDVPAASFLSTVLTEATGKPGDGQPPTQPPRAPHRIPEVQVPHDGNFVSRQAPRRPSQPCSHAHPPRCRHRSSTSPIIYRFSPPLLSSPRGSSSAARDGGVRTNRTLIHPAIATLVELTGPRRRHRSRRPANLPRRRKGDE